MFENKKQSVLIVIWDTSNRKNPLLTAFSKIFIIQFHSMLSLKTKLAKK